MKKIKIYFALIILICSCNVKPEPVKQRVDTIIIAGYDHFIDSITVTSYDTIIVYDSVYRYLRDSNSNMMVNHVSTGGRQ